MEKSESFHIKEIDRKATGRIIRKSISDAGLTVLEASEYLGLETPRVLYRWFRGDSVPTTERLAALAAVTGKCPGDLIALKDGLLPAADFHTGCAQKKRETHCAPLLFEYLSSEHISEPMGQRDRMLLYHYEFLRSGLIFSPSH